MLILRRKGEVDGDLDIYNGRDGSCKDKRRILRGIYIYS